MKDEFVSCEVCSRSTCYKQYVTEKEYSLLCLSCGQTTHSHITDGSKLDLDTFEQSPELYKDLRFVDKNNLVWYPATVTLPDKGMVFLDGTDKRNWKWASVKAVHIPKEEASKFPKGQTHKIDMSTIVHFGQDEYTMALEHIGFFSS
jgi:hypothetical protein